MRLIVHATNTSQGGGWSLLSAVLDALPKDMLILVQLDCRMMLPTNIPSNIKVRWVKPSIFQRLVAEMWLVKHVQKGDQVICFGSLAPLLKLRGHITVFIQNRYLIEKIKLGGFPFKTRLRLNLERIWLAWTASNVDEFIVQTPAMKAALLLSGYVKKQSVHIRPFLRVSDGYQRAILPQDNCRAFKKFDFIYVASGEPHKNHRSLIKAWCLLAEQKIFPSLCLTLDATVSAELCGWIDEQASRYDLKLENVGSCPHTQIVELYSQARALIYPSRFESLGLPLIEARQAGLSVLAAELDYVRDVLDPEQSFDPDSPVSIARGVKRYLGEKEPALQLTDAEGFLRLFLEGLR